ncbi:MAG: hypothetical protein ACR2OD_01700, partial [Gaiellaceae bacterium]
VVLRPRRSLNLRPLVVAALVAGAATFLAPIASGQHARNAWSGSWDTSFGGFALRYLSEDAAKDLSAADVLFNRLNCEPDAKYYRGGYTSGGDAGRIMFCTKAGDDRLDGRFISNSDSSNLGSMDLRLVRGEPHTFTGTFTPDGGSAGDWSGTWRDHFGGDNADEAPPKKLKGLVVETTMPARFGKKGKNGLVKYPTAKQIAPSKWRVDFVVKRRDGKPCRRADKLAVKGGNAKFFKKGRNPCRFYGLFPKEGQFTLRLALQTGKGAKRKVHRGTPKVVVQDWLIVGIGDSNGSGEGAPDIANSTTRVVRWQEKHCHRSANSYQALTARAIERGDKRTSVTFMHLACSGAAIESGVLGTYNGITGRKRFAPQIQAMQNRAKGREIDAVIVSIGVNDLGFGALVKFCIETPNCPAQPFPNADSPQTLAQVMQQRLASLINVSDFGVNDGLYDRLARAFKLAKIPPRRVFITEYFDSTQNAQGTCNPLIEVFLPDIVIGEGLFDGAEAQWASDSVLGPLNTAVHAAAEKHGWRLAFGSEVEYRSHGYCSTDSWIVGLTESIALQGNGEGTLHSTLRGNIFQAHLVTRLMRPEFYENGKPRVPALS